MKISDLPQFTELAEGDRVLVVRADGVVGVVDKSLLGDSTTPPPEPEPSGLILTYASNGDENGLFCYLGTNGKTEPFSNPSVRGLVVASQSTLHNGNPEFGAAPMMNRANQVAHTSNGAEEWFQWDLKDKKLIPSWYTYQGRKDFNGHHPRSWKLQARVLETDAWTDLDSQTNNTSVNFASYYSSPLTSTTAYRFLRTLMTGPNSNNDGYLTGSSVEFYGELIG